MCPEIVVKPKIDISPEILNQFKTQSQTEGQVIVHCFYPSPLSSFTFIRIWRSTYLFDLKGPHKSELVFFENIALAPQWQMVPANSVAHFTLVFTSLPKSCTSFDLVEQIPLSGAFEVRNILRNSSDVYYVKI